MIARDGPAQVDNRGRRRDGDFSFTIVRTARAVVERRDGQSGPSLGKSPTDVSLTNLADALGMSEYSPKDFQALLSASWRLSAALFSCRHCGREATSPFEPDRFAMLAAILRVRQNDRQRK